MSKEVRLGLFITITLTMLFIGIFFIGNKEMLFKSTYKLKTQFQNVNGLNEGADVRVGGIHRGTVKDIELPKQPDGKVTVVMDMQSATRDILRKDSQAAIKSEGLLGDKYVEVTFGSPSAAKLKNGGMIASVPPLDMSDLLAKANQILGSAGETANNLQSITAKINQGSGSAGALINDKTMYNHATKAVSNLQADTEALKHNFLLRGFFKNRGYEDAAELTKHGIARLPKNPPMKVFNYDESKIFDKPDNAKLKDQKTLNDAGQFLQENKFGLAVVASAAGPKGDSDKEKKLTEARSVSVREYLVKNFRLDDTRIRTIGLGKTDSPEESGQLEIIVYPAGSAASSQSAPATTPETEKRAGR